MIRAGDATEVIALKQENDRLRAEVERMKLENGKLLNEIAGLHYRLREAQGEST